MKILLYSLLLLLLTSCGQKSGTTSDTSQTQHIEESTVSEIAEKQSEEVELEYKYQPSSSFYGRDISKLIGFAICDMEDENFDSSLHLTLLSDDDVYLQFTGEQLLEKYPLENGIAYNQPWVYNAEPYNAIVWSCVGEDDNFYRIISDERTGAIHKIGKGGNVKFQTFAEHLSTVIIETDFKNNPIRTAASEDSELTDLDQFSDSFLFVTNGFEIDGDWLSLKSGTQRNEDVEKPISWIRWKKDNKLVIDIFYAL